MSAGMKTEAKPTALVPFVREHLDDARRRTLAVLEPFDDAALTRQVSPLMSPLVWDLAHIAHYEELWLIRALTKDAPTDARHDDLYDAFAHPRRERAGLPILGPADARMFLSSVRRRALDVLDVLDLDSDDPLTAQAFVYGMVIQHEHQHIETMLATINLMEQAYDVTTESTGPRRVAAAGELAVPGGTFVMGTDDEPWAYDNERPAHEIELAPYRIDAAPVRNDEFAAFIADGGYDRPALWSEAGWTWRREAHLEHPQGWHRDPEGAWSVLQFGRRRALAGDEPVEHVCWYEADAFARWAGKRLPTEAEWEHAASTLRVPGLAGVGEVWEWTSSDFAPYPGFRSFPYREYSEVFFGNEYKVLRGASWAAHPVTARTTFRNWDYPIRRQIFAGFRCARDA